MDRVSNAPSTHSGQHQEQAPWLNVSIVLIHMSPVPQVKLHVSFVRQELTILLLEQVPIFKAHVQLALLEAPLPSTQDSVVLVWLERMLQEDLSAHSVGLEHIHPPMEPLRAMPVLQEPTLLYLHLLE